MTWLGRLARRWTAVALLVAPLVACAANTQERRYSKGDIEQTLGPDDGSRGRASAHAALVIGEFPLDKARAILDGDTVRVVGLDATLRLLGVDTEETFKHDKERRLFALGWEPYLKAVRGDSKRPVKMATPVGDEAKKWAEKFFDGSPIVRLERDHPGEIRDFYNRYLAYVFAKKNGRWVNYNVEVVRAGYSPYFTKYGQSRRFHREFVEAQAEAQAAERGIWDPAKQHYPDYAERLLWWNARGEAVAAFEAEAGDRPDFISLTRFDAMEALAANVGKQVVLFGLVGEIVKPPGEKSPTLVKLQKNRLQEVPVVFFDQQVLEASGLANRKSEYVRIRGKVTKYRDRLQIVVYAADQVTTYPMPLAEPAVVADDEQPDGAFDPLDAEPPPGGAMFDRPGLEAGMTD